MRRASPTPAVTGNPAVSISARAAERLRAGHVWVYRSDIERQAPVGDPLAPGALVDVLNPRGHAIGSALYSSASVIALRLISRQAIGRAALLAEWLPRQLRAAGAYRERMVRNTDAYRVVFSEADGLPGLIVDRYAGVLVLQALTQAFDRPDFREVVLRELQLALGPQAIYERVDPRIRALEKLPAAGDRLLWAPAHVSGEAQASDRLHSTTFSMNGLRFSFEPLGGQKTGAFLDQRENYAAVERYAHGRALDVFCYQGGFALHLARACSSVTGVDSSRPALEAAERNAGLNRSPGALDIEWMEANAFDLLKDYAAAGEQYDTIVLDPPAFAKNRASLETAMRGYKELNLRALKMLRPGGILATCSCSYHVSPAEFSTMLASAAADAHRTVRILEHRGAALDHPEIATIPETAYLKCAVAEVN